MIGTRRKRILMVVGNPSVSTATGWPVGFWASEPTHAYDAFVKKGYEVVVASPDGGKVELDSLSDPRDAVGYSKDDTLSLAYFEKPEFAALLERTPSVRDLRAADFDAIVVAGGQSPMLTFQAATGLQELFTQSHRAGKVSAALCHGVSLLLYLKAEDGRSFLAGRRVTGFANSEEDFAGKIVGRKLMPFRIEEEARTLGAEFVAAPALQPHAVRDGNLITGQQQHPGAETARLVVAAVEEGGS